MRACGICRADVSRPARGVPLCARCLGAEVTVRTARVERPPMIGVRTFYVASFRPGVPADGSWPWCESCRSYHHPVNPTCMKPRPEYVVKRMGHTRITCNCPDYIHRGQVEGRACKHIRVVRLLTSACGGIRHVPAAMTMTFTLNGRAMHPPKGRR